MSNETQTAADRPAPNPPSPKMIEIARDLFADHDDVRVTIIAKALLALTGNLDEQQSKTEKVELVRITHSATISSGGRRSWAKAFTSIDRSGKGAHAFVGDYLPEDVQVEMPVGTLIVEVFYRGSKKHSYQSPLFYLLTSHGWEIMAKGEEELDWRSEFISVLDRAEEVIKQARG